MALDTPILMKRIPQGNVANRQTVWYDQYAATGGYVALDKAIAMEPANIVNEMKASELRGRGGAGFPAGMKWSFLPPPDGGHRFLAVNADESEPATFKDQLLINCDPHMLIEGIAICMKACHLDTAYIYIRGEYHHHRVTLEKAVQEAWDKGVFGENSRMGQINGRVPRLYVQRGAGAYICGEETALLESLEGKRGWPRNKPPFPAVSGAFARPTVINNVETLATVPAIIENGAAWFKTFGVPRPEGAPPQVPAAYGTKLYGISGPVNNPGVFEDHLGIKLSTLIEQQGGGMQAGKKFKSAFHGGISMGVLGADQYDAVLDFDIGKRCGVLGLGTACVTVIPHDVSMVAMARNCARFYSHESCGQCTPCREGSNWAYKLLSRIEAGEGTTKDLDLLSELAGSMGSMPGSTICGLADGTSWAIRTILNKFWGEFEALVAKPQYVSLAVR